MSSSKVIISFIGLVLAVFAISKITSSSGNHSESYINVPRAVKLDRVMGSPGSSNRVSLPSNISLVNDSNFVSYPSFQANISPRAAPVNYPAQIRYNMPSKKNLALDPDDPLTLGDMVHKNFTRENYSCGTGKCGTCNDCNGVPNCKKGGVPPLGRRGSGGERPALNKNYVNAMNDMFDQHGMEVAQGSLPVGDMTSISADGSSENVVVYDRLMMVNQKSRLAGLGDPIRGDLAIAPCVASGWFTPSANPNVDLRQGAMQVIGGVGNETALETAKLKFASSGNSDPFSGGIDMTTHFETTLGAGFSDVTTSAFP